MLDALEQLFTSLFGVLIFLILGGSTLYMCGYVVVSAVKNPGKALKIFAVFAFYIFSFYGTVYFLLTVLEWNILVAIAAGFAAFAVASSLTDKYGPKFKDD